MGKIAVFFVGDKNFPGGFCIADFIKDQRGIRGAEFDQRVGYERDAETVLGHVVRGHELV